MRAAAIAKVIAVAVALASWVVVAAFVAWQISIY